MSDSPTYSTDVSQVSSVWSAHGHRFMSDGGEGTETCLTCGAMYQLLAIEGEPTRGEYLAADGSEPMACTYDTSMNHGYGGEKVCETCNDESCEHCTHDCNCLFCNS